METLTTTKTEENINLIKTAFDNFLKGNIQGILDNCTDDIEWGAYHHPVVPFAKTYHGKKGAAEFFATLGEVLNYTRFEPKEFFADRDAVLVRGYHEAVVKKTGKTFGHEFLMHFKVRNGKTSYFFAFTNILDQVQAFTK